MKSKETLWRFGRVEVSFSCATLGVLKKSDEIICLSYISIYEWRAWVGGKTGQSFVIVADLKLRVLLIEHISSKKKITTIIEASNSVANFTESFTPIKILF